MTDLTAEMMTVEVAYAEAQCQQLAEIRLPIGATVADALAASTLAARFPELDVATGEVGVWGKIVSRATALQHGDRVELYRELMIDPREARRLLAESGRTMSQGQSAD